MTDEQRTGESGDENVLQPSPMTDHEAPMDNGRPDHTSGQDMPAHGADDPAQQAPGATDEEPAL